MTAPAQPPTRPPARREPRPWTDFDRLSESGTEDRATVGSAILLTLLFHGMLFIWVLPWLDQAMQASRASATLAPATPAPPPVVYDLKPMTKDDLQALHYVEANPAAPVSKPDNSKNISDRDQQVAQPVPNPNGNADMPATNGTLEHSPKIVQGVNHPSPPEPTPAPAPKPAPAQQTPPAPTPATAPPPVVVAENPSAQKEKPTTTDGQGLLLNENPGPAKTEIKPEEVPPTVAQQEMPLPPGPLTPELVAASANAATPEARPSAPVKTHAGLLIKEIQGTHRAGLYPGVDANFSQYGEYLSLMFEAISSSWVAQCDQFSFTPRDWGTQVDTAFVINAQGEVVDVKVESSTASRAATLMCVKAISGPAPYGKWDPAMRALLGEEQTVRIIFSYQ